MGRVRVERQHTGASIIVLRRHRNEHLLLLLHRSKIAPLSRVEKNLLSTYSKILFRFNFLRLPYDQSETPFWSSKRPRGPRGAQELPNDKKTAAPRLLDRLLFRYPPPQMRLEWDVLSVTFNGKFQRQNRFFDAWLPNDFEGSSPWLSK